MEEELTSLSTVKVSIPHCRNNLLQVQVRVQSTKALASKYTESTKSKSTH